MTRKGKEALLIDSKLFSPKVSLRTLDDEAYQKDVDRAVKALKQAYIQAHEKFNNDYYPFSIEVEDVYALVVVYQESYLDYEAIYSQTAHVLSISKESPEYSWLWHHVGLTDIATIERYMLTRTDMFSTLKERETITDIWLPGQNGNDLTERVLHYEDKLIKDADRILHELYDKASN